jgi:signal transduction histidine kinase
MTGGIAHDFRNVLAVIDSALRLMERWPSDPTKASMCIAGARDGVAQGLALTSHLLSFAGHRDADTCAAVDLNLLLKDIELFLRYGAGTQVNVVLDLSADIPHCLIDRSQFKVAILNLVLNARDAMPSGGEIRICTKSWFHAGNTADGPRGNYVRVRVADDGIGMSHQTLEHIFEPFFTTKGEHGTGLGIPQVGAFVRHVGGYVRVSSEIGVGTTFDLFFRVARKGEMIISNLHGSSLVAEGRFSHGLAAITV